MTELPPDMGPHLSPDTPPEIRVLIDGIRDRMRNTAPSDLSNLDQLKALAGDQARELMAYYMLAGLHNEKNQIELQENAAIKMVLILKPLSHFQVVGVALVLAEFVAEFLLAQGDGTYASALSRLMDPDQPLIPGRSSPNDDPLWRLTRETGE